jgi:hypothetical protein
MYKLEYNDAISSDTHAAHLLIMEFFTKLDEIEKVDRWITSFENSFDELMDNLKSNPRIRQVYEFKPHIETQHDYRAAVVSWFTVFWWIEEDAQICHVYRILNSKSDFTKADGW